MLGSEVPRVLDAAEDPRVDHRFLVAVRELSSGQDWARISLQGDSGGLTPGLG